MVIGLVEVLWKVCSVVVSLSLKRSVVLHDTLRGLREGRRVGTDTLEAKLAQNLAGVAHKPLFQVFLDVCKAYSSLDRGQFLVILRGCMLGLNLDRILKNYRKRHMIVSMSGMCLGTVFWALIGVTQSNPASLMIFNIVVDAVVQAVLGVVYIPQESKHGIGWVAGKRNLVFYVDYDRIAWRDHEWVQDALTVIVAMFRRIGLGDNLEKTKAVVCTTVLIWGKWGETVYK